MSYLGVNNSHKYTHKNRFCLATIEVFLYICKDKTLPFMKKTLFTALLASLLTLSCSKEEIHYDICIYGGTSAGVIAAASAAQLGMNVLIVEPSQHIGGMTTGGLGLTDIGRTQRLRGLAGQFYRDLGKHYGCDAKWVFEPSAASQVFAKYLDNERITVMKGYGLEKVEKRGAFIGNIEIVPLDREWRPAGEPLSISAKAFIDASYEGDLMAASGVSFTTGREGSDVYGENWNGCHISVNHQFPDGIDPYVETGNPDSGLLWGISPVPPGEEGSGDDLIQAYNMRICLTDSLENMIPITRPERYDSLKYELLARLLALQGEGGRYFIWSKMPRRKTDINNYGGFSTDMIGCNYNYVSASYPVRKTIVDEHRDYTMGLLWFMSSDPRVPQGIRDEMARWGYPKDEFVSTGHWTPQLYVREARRMVSDYVATQADCEGRRVAEDGVAQAAYTMDSHNCQRVVVNGMVKNEGNVEIGIPGPYPVSYRSIVPRASECDNLLVPVCLSASHIAYGSIRMEPVFMNLGEVAAIAAMISIRDHKPVQDVDYKEINDLLSDGASIAGTSAEGAV